MKKLLLILSLTLAASLSFGQAPGYPLANFATSGPIGTAAATVDVYSRININQTTPSITLTVPAPTNKTTKVTEVWIANKGTVPFTLVPGSVIDTGTAIILKWIGDKYTVVGKGGTSALAGYIKIDGTSPATTGNIKLGNDLGVNFGGASNAYIQGSNQTGGRYVKSYVTEGLNNSGVTINNNNIYWETNRKVGFTTVESSSMALAPASATFSRDSGSTKFSTVQLNAIGIGLRGSNTNSSAPFAYFRTDSLLSDIILQSPKISGQVALKSDITSATGAYIKLDGSSSPTTGIVGIGNSQGFNQTDGVATGRVLFINGSPRIQSENDDDGTFSQLSVDANQGIVLSSSNSTGNAILKTTNLTTDRNIEFPNSSGTIALTSDIPAAIGAQSANRFYAGPTTGSAAIPTFRAIVPGDVPILNQNTTGNAGTATALQTPRTINGTSFNGTSNITITAAPSGTAGGDLAGTYPNPTVSGSVVKSVVLNTPNVVFSNPVTFSTSTNTATGSLSLNTQSSNTVFAGPSTGSAATPTFRALTSADLPATLVGKQIGPIISDDFNRASLGTAYTQVGAFGVGITSNKLSLSGSGSYSTYIFRNDWYPNIKTWNIEADYTIDPSGAGLAIILKGSASSFYKIDNTGKLFIDYDFPTLTNAANSGSNTVAFSAGETIHIVISRSNNSVTFTAYNITTPSNQTAVTANVDLTGAGFTFGAVPRIAIAQLGGNNTVDNLVYSTKIKDGMDLVVLHNSIGDGYNAGSSGQEWINHVSSTLNINVERLGTSGNKTSDMVNSLPELGLLKPRYALDATGVNDASSSVSLTTFQNNKIAFINYCRSIGVIPIFTTVPPTTTPAVVTNVDIYNAWLTGTVRDAWGIQVIDITTFLKDGGSALALRYSSDGVHWTFNGHAGVGAIVSNSLIYRFKSDRVAFQEDGFNVNIGTTYNTTPTKHTSAIYKGIFLGDGNYLYNELQTGFEGLSLSTNRALLLGGQAVAQYINKPSWRVNLSYNNDAFNLYRAPLTGSNLVETPQFSVKGNATTGYSNFGFNRIGNTGNYTVDITNPLSAETTLRLNSTSTPTYGFMEFSINGTQVSYFSPQAGLSLNSSNNSTAGRGAICQGANFAYPSATNILFQAIGTAPVIGQINTNGYVQYASNRAGVAGTGGLTLLTASGAQHIFADRVGIGTITPNAYLTVKAGDASVPAVTMTSGTVTTTPVAGAVEYDGSKWYFTPSTVRYENFIGLSGSATLDFPSTASGASSDLTISVTGAALSDVISLGIPNSSMPAAGTNGSYIAWVSAANTITVRYMNTNTVSSVDPASGLFKIRIIQ